MKQISVKNRVFLIPSIEEWEQLFHGSIDKIDNVITLKSKYIEGFIKYAIQCNTLLTSKTIGTLEKREIRGILNWYPTILYFPNRQFQKVDVDIFDIANEDFIHVNFSRFHCFDCSLDLDGYAINRHSYILRKKELEEVYEKYDFFRIKCPKCYGNLRNPGIIQITKSY